MEQLAQIFGGVLEFKWQYLIMYAIGGILIYLAIKKDYEPMLLLPIGFGAILVNLPFKSIWEYEPVLDETVTKIVNQFPALQEFFTEHFNYVFENGQAYKVEPGLMQIIFNSGILTELFPCLIFIAVGAMCDFTPLLKTPKMIFFGAAAQFGIFFTVLVALVLNKIFPGLGFDLKAAASIGIIGAADGPTSIFVASKFAKHLLGPISVAAYSYMSLVPIIQPPVIKALTTKKERMIRMEYKDVKVSKTALILFPICVTIIAGIIAPSSVALVGLLMFGNLLRECGVVERLSKAAQNELSNLVTLLLGITIGSTMYYENFLSPTTLFIMLMGLVAFVFDTVGGILLAKLMNLFSKEKVNPMVGAAGISAFPMSARIVQKMAIKEDPSNFILMHAVGANVAGQLGSIVAGGMVLALVPWLLTL
ncbi:glutaconyl-CoA decarboxylase subunit beta [Thermoclostridium stercorarium subsp. thermolacticum DSM 2910]|uniref:Glutaconyl-CoA decarboxylase subunit beta n=2 Tax=Thermoclostridium stercorarium TaxID=1510 RepID=A0A1B1YK62_THEST|nr:sodium ion-translocating decarboxylase subunit beta [Thermoclostridium stercorarium]ANW98574.1 glutaconyl-CoA decarboxylase subunit beta [Thermoclostridium stercorarium subsp. thermolacticum DSM 2910]ANX01112.1 glutaconyl-CoA decarboxylase subunit beta [Thermoclostridium stercorarium subsp. leptospartum DSM 9219]UZQ86730.1 sodium ion-translocating decarboxylase subunit beta [Thermoclostridium stercorarium]